MDKIRQNGHCKQTLFPNADCQQLMRIQLHCGFYISHAATHDNTWSYIPFLLTKFPIRMIELCGMSSHGWQFSVCGGNTDPGCVFHHGTSFHIYGVAALWSTVDQNTASRAAPSKHVTGQPGTSFKRATWQQCATYDLSLFEYIAIRLVVSAAACCNKSAIFISFLLKHANHLEEYRTTLQSPMDQCSRLISLQLLLLLIFFLYELGSLSIISFILLSFQIVSLI